MRPSRGPMQPLRPGPHLWADDELLKLYYTVNHEQPGRPTLPDNLWAEIDALIAGVIADLRSTTGMRVVFALTDLEVERCALLTSVFFEPLAGIVVALGHVEHDMSIAADQELWHTHEDDFRRLINPVERLLQDGSLADALRLAADGLRRIFVPAATH